MTAIRTSERRTTARPLPPLENGERMKQPEFHRRYEAFPRDRKIELINGIVFMASPERIRHGESHPELSGVLWLYKNATPGTHLLDNTTAIIDVENEPQPDLALRILPAYGGQTRDDEDGYQVGIAELVNEVAHSSRSIDLNQKLQIYERAGAKEYIVLNLEDGLLHWFDFVSKNEIKPSRDGISRSRVFPGLWIDSAALVACDSARLTAVVLQGLASRAHQAFVKKLAARRK